MIYQVSWVIWWCSCWYCFRPCDVIDFLGFNVHKRNSLFGLSYVLSPLMIMICTGVFSLDGIYFHIISFIDIIFVMEEISTGTYIFLSWYILAIGLFIHMTSWLSNTCLGHRLNMQYVPHIWFFSWSKNIHIIPWYFGLNLFWWYYVPLPFLQVFLGKFSNHASNHRTSCSYTFLRECLP